MSSITMGMLITLDLLKWFSMHDRFSIDGTGSTRAVTEWKRADSLFPSRIEKREVARFRFFFSRGQ
jgi:uncharacterized membrane protein